MAEHRKVQFFGFDLDSWTKMILGLKSVGKLMSNGWSMLDLADASHFARKMHKKVIFFLFGLDTLAKLSLSFEFGWVVMSNG